MPAHRQSRTLHQYFPPPAVQVSSVQVCATVEVLQSAQTRSLARLHLRLGTQSGQQFDFASDDDTIGPITCRAVSPIGPKDRGTRCRLKTHGGSRGTFIDAACPLKSTTANLCNRKFALIEQGDGWYLFVYVPQANAVFFCRAPKQDRGRSKQRTSLLQHVAYAGKALPNSRLGSYRNRCGRGLSPNPLKGAAAPSSSLAEIAIRFSLPRIAPPSSILSKPVRWHVSPCRGPRRSCTGSRFNCLARRSFRQLARCCGRRGIRRGNAAAAIWEF